MQQFEIYGAQLWRCFRISPISGTVFNRLCSKRISGIVFTTSEEKIKEKQLVLWENMNADEYARKQSLVELDTSEYKIQETRDK